MTELELREKVLNLKDELKGIIANGETEKRELNENETSRMAEIRSEIDATEAEIRNLEAENERLAQQAKEEEERNKINNTTNIETKMKKEVRLVDLINGVIEGRNFNEEERKYVNNGVINLRSAIVAGTAEHGQEVVPEDKMGLDIAVRNASVLNRLGCTWFSQAKGDISIPRYSGSSCLWKSEVAEAGDGAGTFSEVVLKPKRLTATVDISKQFLAQAADEVEGLLISDLANAISQKLDQTVFGNTTGDTQPAGLFAGETTATSLSDVTYSDVLALEEEVESKNGYNIVFVANPKVKYALKGTDKASGYGKMVFEDGEIDGYPAIVSNSVISKGIACMDPRDLAVAVWDNAEITVDNYTRASFGEVRLVVNYYVDAALRGDRIALEIFG